MVVQQNHGKLSIYIIYIYIYISLSLSSDDLPFMNGGFHSYVEEPEGIEPDLDEVNIYSTGAHKNWERKKWVPASGIISRKPNE